MNPAAIPLTSSLAFSSVLARCCCISSSSSVSWLWFKPSALFEQKSLFESILQARSVKADPPTAIRIQKWAAHKTRRVYLFDLADWFDLKPATLVASLFSSDNTRANQSRGRDRISKQDSPGDCYWGTDYCQWSFLIRCPHTFILLYVGKRLLYRYN